MTKIADRVAWLESTLSGANRLIVAIGPDKMDVAAELATRGIVGVRNDLLVVVRKPVEGPPSIKVDGLARQVISC